MSGMNANICQPTQPLLYSKKSREAHAKKILSVLCDHLGERRLKRCAVLDVGAGTGLIDTVIALQTKRVIGIDMDTEAIAYAKKKCTKGNLKFRIADAMHLPFFSDHFDIVICHQVYEHVGDSKKMFDEIFRVLKPGGICYLAAMNKWFIWEPHYNMPFLSYLPQSVADVYVRLVGRGTYNAERPKSYTQLRKEVKKFTVFDYTEKILNNPKKYYYSIPFILVYFSKILRFLVPTFIWILQK